MPKSRSKEWREGAYAALDAKNSRANPYLVRGAPTCWADWENGWGWARRKLDDIRDEVRRT